MKLGVETLDSDLWLDHECLLILNFGVNVFMGIMLMSSHFKFWDNVLSLSLASLSWLWKSVLTPMLLGNHCVILLVLSC